MMIVRSIATNAADAAEVTLGIPDGRRAILDRSVVPWLHFDALALIDTVHGTTEPLKHNRPGSFPFADLTSRILRCAVHPVIAFVNGAGVSVLPCFRRWFT
jgi:hypothetical protein